MPPQVKTALEMESHEEKLHQMIRQSKINEAKVFACLTQGVRRGLEGLCSCLT